MKPELTTSVAKLSSLFLMVEDYGLNRRDFLLRNNINPTILATPDERLTLEAIHRLTQDAVSITGDDFLGLHQGERFMGLSNILGYILLNCKHLKQALDKIETYQKICDEAAEITLGIQNSIATIQVAIPDERFSNDRQLTDYRLSAIYTYLKRLICKSFPLTEVHFLHSRPTSVDEYNRVFNCPVYFNSNRNCICFSESYLSSTVPEHNTNLLEVMEAYARNAIQVIAPKDSYKQKIARLITNLLPGTTPTIEDVASKIGMSVRTLQLRLKDERTTYSDLLNDIRKDLAIKYLRDQHISITEVAYLLGYSEVSVFYRAFKKWTFKTPKEFRFSMQEEVSLVSG